MSDGDDENDSKIEWLFADITIMGVRPLNILLSAFLPTWRPCCSDLKLLFLSWQVSLQGKMPRGCLATALKHICGGEAWPEKLIAAAITLWKDESGQAILLSNHLNAVAHDDGEKLKKRIGLISCVVWQNRAKNKDTSFSSVNKESPFRGVFWFPLFCFPMFCSLLWNLRIYSFGKMVIPFVRGHHT